MQKSIFVRKFRILCTVSSFRIEFYSRVQSREIHFMYLQNSMIEFGHNQNFNLIISVLHILKKNILAKFQAKQAKITEILELALTSLTLM